MSTAAAARRPDRTFDLRLGPLHYRLVSRDPWGDRMVSNLAGHLAAGADPSPPDRTIVLGADGACCERAGWRHQSSPLGTLWEDPRTTAAAWTGGASTALPPFRYQLPWALLVADIVRRRGALAHAGFAAWHGHGLLFLAPPGGGKSTTLGSAPPDWEVLSDDAALVWPDGDGWQASPLPSWTMMTAAGPGTASPFDPTQQRRLCGLIVLVKGACVALEPLAATAAVPHVLRAFCEYPATVLVNLPLKEQFFRRACALTRALPCWRLQLPLGAAIWPRLAPLVESRG